MDEAKLAAQELVQPDLQVLEESYEKLESLEELREDLLNKIFNPKPSVLGEI